MKALRIWWLKRRARAQLFTFRNLQAGDGGNHITNVIRGGEVSRAARKFNATIRTLKAIDPAAAGVPEIGEGEYK